MSQNPNDRSIFFHFLQLCLDAFLPFFGLILLGVLGESLLLGFAPVLIEPTLHLLTQVLSPNCVQRTKATWSLNISHHSNYDHRRSLNNCNSFTCLLLVKLCRILVLLDTALDLNCASWKKSFKRCDTKDLFKKSKKNLTKTGYMIQINYKHRRKYFQCL